MNEGHQEEPVETMPDAAPTPAQPAGPSPLRTSLSQFQTVVGLMAGIVSITGALVSFSGYSKHTPTNGQLVAVVHDRSDAPVGGATVEVLTHRKAIVTTLAVNAQGRVSLPIEPGAYILRFNHPRLGSEVRLVEIRRGLTAEVHMALRGSGNASARASTAPAGGNGRAGNPGAAAARRSGARVAEPGSTSVAASPDTEPRPANDAGVVPEQRAAPEPHAAFEHRAASAQPGSRRPVPQTP